MIIDKQEKEQPRYYSTMYLEGYSPAEILMAKRRSMYEDYKEDISTKDMYVSLLDSIMKAGINERTK